MNEKSVLIVDDNEPFLGLEVEILQKHFPSVFAATTAQQALEIFKEHDGIPVVIFDLQMPGMNGIQMAREMRIICKNVELLMITAHLDDVSATQAMAIGAYPIPKPVEPSMIWLAAIRLWLNYYANHTKTHIKNPDLDLDPVTANLI